ncbi:allergen Bos d 2 [Camelus ferus]|uniref:Allergen Bos d 2 n=1 Tax=Camelus ferus TaxID=419612 RepID=A0A8B8SP52_CAMFR|nr:allergen Bos d 2 [Camelus ferus]
MKTLLLRLVLGVLCAAQITGEWHTIYTASDNVQKIQENGSLRGYSHRTECSNGCKTLSITYCIKWNLPKFSGKNYFQLIHVSKNMLVIYAENIDGDETTHLTEVTAKGRDLNEAEYKKFEELPKDKGVLTENTEHVISTGAAFGIWNSRRERKSSPDWLRVHTVSHTCPSYLVAIAGEAVNCKGWNLSGRFTGRLSNEASKSPRAR